MPCRSFSATPVRLHKAQSPGPDGRSTGIVGLRDPIHEVATWCLCGAVYLIFAGQLRWDEGATAVVLATLATVWSILIRRCSTVHFARPSHVLARDRKRQIFALAANGLALGALFFALQAPDVALSEIAVNTVITPLLFMPKGPACSLLGFALLRLDAIVAPASTGGRYISRFS